MLSAGAPLARRCSAACAMLAAAVFGIFVIPMLDVVFQWRREPRSRREATVSPRPVAEMDPANEWNQPQSSLALTRCWASERWRLTPSRRAMAYPNLPGHAQPQGAADPLPKHDGVKEPTTDPGRHAMHLCDLVR